MPVQARIQYLQPPKSGLEAMRHPMDRVLRQSLALSSTSDRESEDQEGTYYHHNGWKYYEVPIEDYHRAGISRRIGRVVSKLEYSIYRVLLRSSDASVKDICQALDITAGAGRWDELRRRCQSYRTTLAGKREIRDDLKNTIGITLLSKFLCSSRIHFQS